MSMEEALVNSAVSSGVACTTGVHGDGGGYSHGSRTGAAPPVSSGKKEEGAGLDLGKGNITGQKW